MNLRQAKLMLKLADYLHAFIESHPCGTSACAMGHAATMPCFQRLGLWLDKKSGWVVFEPPGVCQVDPIRNLDAAEHIFGITSDESSHLFGDYERTAKQEATVLRRFVYKRFPQLKPEATKKKAVKK